MVEPEEKKRGFWGTSRRVVLGFRSPHKSFKGVGEGWSVVRDMAGQLVGSDKHRGLPCPMCPDGRLVIGERAIFIQARPDELEIPSRVFGCSSCGYTRDVPVFSDAQAPMRFQRAEALRGAANVIFLGAFASLALGCAASIYVNGWFPLLGGAAMAALVSQYGLIRRYRAWQLVYGRLFERKAPFGDWLRFELNGEKTAPDAAIKPYDGPP